MQQSRKNRLPLSPIKGYGGTWGIFLLGLIYAYTGWPIEPRMPATSEAQELVGMPDFKYSAATKTAGSLHYFTVGGTRLNSYVGYLGGAGGYGFFEKKIDRSKPVRATYFWAYTRLNSKDRMLHALEQEGTQLVSPQQFYLERVRNNMWAWKIYYQILGFTVLVFAVLWFIERNILNTAKHKHTH